MTEDSLGVLLEQFMTGSKVSECISLFFAEIDKKKMAMKEWVIKVVMLHILILELTHFLIVPLIPDAVQSR